MKLRLPSTLVVLLLALQSMSLVSSSLGADVLDIPASYTKTNVSLSSDFGSSYEASG